MVDGRDMNPHRKPGCTCGGATSDAGNPATRWQIAFTAAVCVILGLAYLYYATSSWAIPVCPQPPTCVLKVRAGSDGRGWVDLFNEAGERVYQGASGIDGAIDVAQKLGCGVKT